MRVLSILSKIGVLSYLIAGGVPTSQAGAEEGAKVLRFPQERVRPAEQDFSETPLCQKVLINAALAHSGVNTLARALSVTFHQGSLTHYRQQIYELISLMESSGPDSQAWRLLWIPVLFFEYGKQRLSWTTGLDEALISRAEIQLLTYAALYPQEEDSRKIIKDSLGDFLAWQPRHPRGDEEWRLAWFKAWVNVMGSLVQQPEEFQDHLEFYRSRMRVSTFMARRARISQMQTPAARNWLDAVNSVMRTIDALQE